MRSQRRSVLLAPSSPRGRPTWFRSLRAGRTSSQTWLKTLRHGADSLGQRWGWLWDAITAPIRTASTIITTWASNVVQAFKGWVDVIAGLLEGDWERVWEGAKEVLAAVWDTMVEVAK